MSELAPASVPTLVLTGGADPIYAEVASALVALGARHVTLDGTGHRPQDRADGVAAIAEFWSQQGGPPPLRLRPLRVTDEQQSRRAHEELAREGFSFLLDLRDGEPWPTYLHRLQRGVDLPAGWVPATFLVAEVEGQLVGRVSVRHELNADLAEFGGHIGYAVRPAFRRRAYATDILRQALGVAGSLGVQRALVTCDVDNVASAKVIERCGGALAGVSPARDGSAGKRRYWIESAAN